jgi:hypothetical protein
VIALVSLLVVLVILGYGAAQSITQGPGAIGASFVNVEFPPSNLSPIYFKPITILYIAGGLLLYSGLEVGKARISALSPAKKALIKAFSFIVAVVFVFEVGYNFAYWSGQIAAESVRGTLNPDLIANPFPSLVYDFNIVFASKLTTLFMLSGLYTFYFMTRLESEAK